MRAIPKPYEIYRHFKGNMYQILNIAIHSETGEQMVVYQQLYAPYAVYVRPLAMFMSKTDREKYPNAMQEFRFEQVELFSGTQSVEEKMVSKEPVKAATVNTEPSETLIKREKSKEENNALVQPYEEQVSQEEEEFQLEPGLLKFLEADSYEEKLEIVTQLHPQITDAMIDTMAVSLDMEIKQGELEQRYSELINSLLTLEHFECNRLR